MFRGIAPGMFEKLRDELVRRRPNGPDGGSTAREKVGVADPVPGVDPDLDSFTGISPPSSSGNSSHIISLRFALASASMFFSSASSASWFIVT